MTSLLHKANQKKDWNGGFRHVLEKAVACDEVVSAYEKSDHSSHYTPRHEQKSNGSLSREKSHNQIRTVTQTQTQKERVFSSVFCRCKKVSP